jgi:hypothetical protein
MIYLITLEDRKSPFLNLLCLLWLKKAVILLRAHLITGYIYNTSNCYIEHEENLLLLLLLHFSATSEASFIM